MKNIKKISLIFVILIISVVFINDNLLNTFATDYTKDTIKVGEIYKSGDAIEIAEFENCEPGIKDECRYDYSVNFSS